MKEQALVSFRRLGRSFQEHGFSAVARACVQAVRDIDLDIEAGRTLGIVGESGCGKSTLGRMAVGLLEPSAGEVLVMGRSLYDRKAHADYAAFRRGLAGRIQMIFQDPYLSLNPRMNIGRCVAEPLICSQSGPAAGTWGRREDSASANLCERGGTGGRAYVREQVARVLEQVGLEADAARRYPHEFSGGQRQRIAVARALITAPDFVVCDEPTSSLDASVQSQVLNLLQDMQRKLSLSYMFISHDLAVVRHMSDRLAVMYRGFLVEEGDAEAVFQKPCHPYTRLLLESVPGIENPGTDPQVDCGDESSAGQARPAADPSLAPQNNCRTNARAQDREACPFAPRCPHVFFACFQAVPELTTLGKPLGLSGSPPSHRRVRCLLYKEA